MNKTYFNWSTGKDAALSLYLMQQDKDYHVDRLLTSISAHYDRVSMHGLRRSVLERQINAIDLPLSVIELPEDLTMQMYEKIMMETVDELKSMGYTHCGFGDIFLEDLRTYREQQLVKHNIKCFFPLWKKDTRALITQFLELEFRAIVVCVNGSLLDKSFVGRMLDMNFINDLPLGVDPCGENGEFHTFCFEGPIFKNKVCFEIGEIVSRVYPNPQSDASEDVINFWFCDLI